MKAIKLLLIVVPMIAGVDVLGQIPTSYSLENPSIILEGDTVYFEEKVNEPIPPFQNKTMVELVGNDSLRVILVIRFREKSLGKSIYKAKHQFYYHGKKLRAHSRWKSDLPFLLKLTGIGWRWEDRSWGWGLVSSTGYSSSARLPGDRGQVILVGKETVFF